MEFMYQDLPKIGLLGGGQLGRMLLQAGIDLDFQISCLDPDPEAPCQRLAHEFTQGSFQDFDTVYLFGQSQDLISIEIEHVNIDALEKLASEGKQVYPQPHLLRMIQDKRTQKQFFQQYGFPTADFRLIESREEINQHLDFLPAYQKLGKGGYDGKGVQLIADATQIAEGFDAPGLLEKAVDFEKELAVIVARNIHGEVKAFPAVEMVFHPVQNLVEFLISPAAISEEIEAQAVDIATRLIEEMKMVGLLAVEMFLTKDGQVLINEIAPRPHNSGHQTIRANATSQYEQHLRAIAGLPLGDTSTTVFAGMLNLLGEAGYTGKVKYEGLAEALAIPGVFPFLYGKKITKPFRKMGHVSIIGESREEVEEKANQVKKIIRVIS
ncbi:5-(carboxyamino)imidazole ribonucleotide synthase [Aquirufa aurantiipilula]|uniref:N5-carboxyaminoimidazole ribonucleotide synthase n=1 Tax=Aquirufa aurantiipilula TaxID=2696561 RepID=A0ABT6BJ83_9BACT|nr:5-(carboxyamino)imidazole ribonucleotide synthase [Aquirufa aurantiipilula]MDF5690531.1 5-(carboxyamino)imidazole ribonucleotide synthase [Aquirufa aurantiipilula]